MNLMLEFVLRGIRTNTPVTLIGEKKMGIFDKNSWFTKFAEGIPVIGYIPAAVHALAGNEDEARRAAAKSTNSAMVTAGGIGGFLVGGPAGAVAGGAAGGALGATIEGGIATTVHENVRKDMVKLDGTDILIGTAFGGLSGAFSGVSGTIAEEAELSLTKKFIVGQTLNGVFVGVPRAVLASSKNNADGQTELTEAEKQEAASHVTEVASKAKDFVPVLLAGSYTTWFKYGSSGWVEKRPGGLKIEIQDSGSIKLFVTDIEVTGWLLNQNNELTWENEPGASRDGVPQSANIQFNYAEKSFSGYFQYPGEGKIDFRGEFEAPIVNSLIPGDYECHLFDKGGKNDWHYVTVSKVNDTTLRWTNRAGVAWTLGATSDKTKLNVGHDCPYFKDGHTHVTVVWKDNQVSALLGPWDEPYVRST